MPQISDEATRLTSGFNTKSRQRGCRLHIVQEYGHRTQLRTEVDLARRRDAAGPVSEKETSPSSNGEYVRRFQHDRPSRTQDNPTAQANIQE